MAQNTRRQARELALQVLFQLEFAPTQDLAGALQNFKAAFDDVAAETWDYALQVLQGIQSKSREIDQIIQTHTAHWRLERLALVDLNVLRIATFELMTKDLVPAPVAINEAIEVAKKYGSTDSGKFVNGVLDQIRKAVL